jgi:hypothetical protein
MVKFHFTAASLRPDRKAQNGVCVTLQFLKLRAFTGWYWEALCLLVYLVLAGTQLFVPPIVGVADNGDFPKVLAPQNVCDPTHEKDTFLYVYPRYVISANCYWDSRLYSSESGLLAVIKLFATTSGRNSFRITGAGKAHFLFFVAALMILLWAMHDAPGLLRFGVPPFAILVFSDVAYISYLNSFYMDTATMVFLLPAVAALAAWLVRPRIWLPIVFGAAGVLLGFGKMQHAILSFLLAGLAAWFAVRAFRQGGVRNLPAWCWAASATAVAVSTAVLIGITPNDYKAEPLYNLVFFRILPGMPGKLETLADLGLPEAYVEFSGTHAYSKGAPVMNSEWREEFIRHATLTGIAAFYLQNPLFGLRIIWRALREDVVFIRPLNLGNYQAEDGFPPGALAHHFDWWSNLRTWLLRIFPPGLGIFYGVLGFGSLLCLFRPDHAARWPLYPLVLVLVASGIAEFLCAVLLDAIETSRHLFMFHVITELLNVCALAALLGAINHRSMLKKQIP